MQRRQRRTQVMRDVGHQLAPLQVLLAQLLPLFAQPLRHLRVRVLKDHQLVALAGAQRLRWRQWRRCVDVEGLDAPGQPPQRAGHPVERHQPGQQAEAANQHHRPPGGVPLATGGEVVGQHLPVLADQHHVHVTRLTALHDQRRGTEYLAAIRAARIVAEDRQRRAGQPPAQRRHVHPVAYQMAAGRIVAEDAALVVQQVDLDAGVDCHQLAEQGAHCGVAHAAGVHQLAALGDVLGQAQRQPLHHFLFVAGVGTHLQRQQRHAAHQHQCGDHRRQLLPQVRPDHAAAPAGSTSL
ncbi:hypothetical protein G6F35_012728 [Rhizopus arrhizus]|nr:hypothetical protein G6F35_012728 [Rhizopus arrhizus]